MCAVLLSASRNVRVTATGRAMLTVYANSACGACGQRTVRPYGGSPVCHSARNASSSSSARRANARASAGSRLSSTMIPTPGSILSASIAVAPGPNTALRSSRSTSPRRTCQLRSSRRTVTRSSRVISRPIMRPPRSLPLRRRHPRQGSSRRAAGSCARSRAPRAPSPACR